MPFRFGGDAVHVYLTINSYAYVPGAAVVYDPYWDAHQAFLALPKDVQTAFAIRMLFTHRPVDRYGASMFLHYQRGFNVKFEGIGANQY